VFNDFLEQNEISFGYEDFKISYLKPEKPSKYTPDFNCITNENLRIIFETKGQFLTSKTTYAKWCELKGFPYHCIQSTKKFLPDEWVTEVKKLQEDKHE
jgi:hypothetical protein